MKRRNFINNILIGSSGLLLPISLNSCNLKQNKIRFGICSDVHQDIIHDASKRIKTFIREAEEENVDFIIQLGDFCFPIEKNKSFIETWNTFNGPKYHVLGNHDMDVSSKKVTQQFLGMDKPYYSFDEGDFHFVVLDANWYLHEDEYVSYNNGNYYAHSESRANIPPKQLQWLKKDLEQTDKLTFVFSHQSLISPGSIKNQEEVRSVLEGANSKKTKVIACFNGHEHNDAYSNVNGIHYIGINSSSYKWVGQKYESADRFDEKTNLSRPSLKYTIPYAESLFAIVDIDSKGTINIKGKQTTYVPPGPKELGIKNKNGHMPEEPVISNRVLKTIQ